MTLDASSPQVYDQSMSNLQSHPYTVQSSSNDEQYFETRGATEPWIPTLTDDLEDGEFTGVSLTPSHGVDHSPTSITESHLTPENLTQQQVSSGNPISDATSPHTNGYATNTTIPMATMTPYTYPSTGVDVETSTKMDPVSDSTSATYATDHIQDWTDLAISGTQDSEDTSTKIYLDTTTNPTSPYFHSEDSVQMTTGSTLSGATTHTTNQSSTKLFETSLGGATQPMNIANENITVSDVGQVSNDILPYKTETEVSTNSMSVSHESITFGVNDDENLSTNIPPHDNEMEFYTIPMGVPDEHGTAENDITVSHTTASPATTSQDIGSPGTLTPMVLIPRRLYPGTLSICICYHFT